MAEATVFGGFFHFGTTTWLDLAEFRLTGGNRGRTKPGGRESAKRRWRRPSPSRAIIPENSGPHAPHQYRRPVRSVPSTHGQTPQTTRQPQQSGGRTV